MPLKKKTVFSRFNVGAMMKAKKLAREKAAKAHESVQSFVRKLNASKAKQKRLEIKVMTSKLVIKMSNTYQTLL